MIIIIMKKKKISVESMEFGYCPNCIARQFCIAVRNLGWAESVLQYTGSHCRLRGLAGWLYRNTAGVYCG